MSSAEGSSPCFIVKDLETGELFTWGMEEVLFEINRDHSEEFIPYDEKDWQEACAGHYNGELIVGHDAIRIEL